MLRIIYRNVVVSRLGLRFEFDRIEVVAREGGGTVHPLRKALRIPDGCRVDLSYEHELVRG